MGTRRGNAVLLLQLLLRVRSWPKAGCCAETTLQTMLAEQLWASPAGPDRLSLPGSLWVSAENSTGPARLLSCPPGSSCSARLDSAVLYSLGHKLVTSLFIASVTRCGVLPAKWRYFSPPGGQNFWVAGARQNRKRWLFFTLVIFK